MTIFNTYLCLISIFGINYFILCYFTFIHVPISIYATYINFGVKSIVYVCILSVIIYNILSILVNLELKDNNGNNSKKNSIQLKLTPHKKKILFWLSYTIVYIHIILHNIIDIIN